MKSTELPIPRAYWENARWAREHASELHEQYEGQWIAMVNQQVIEDVAWIEEGPA